MASENQSPPSEMAPETQQPPAALVGENQPPPAKRARGNQPPPAEEEGKTQQPPAEIEGETQPTPLPACVSKVLDDDNLLAEIIVRVGFPTSLVRAAAVCRRWLQLASDRAFLRRFRKLHPPRLLGFYIAQREYPDDESFFPMLPQPRPPELAAVVHSGRFSLDFYEGKQTKMLGCWNGRVVTRLHVLHQFDDDVQEEVTFVVHSPLCSKRGMAVIPALKLPIRDGDISRSGQLFSKEEGNVLSYINLLVDSARDGTKSTVHVCMLRNGDDAWHTHLTMVVDNLIYPRSSPKSVLIDNKIYMASSRNEIVVLDLTDSSVSTIQLPQGVDFLKRGATMLSQANDASALYLIHVWKLQLHIWLHKGRDWLLVDNICLREMCAPFLEAQPIARLKINHVGDYTAEFLFFQMGRMALYLDVKCRTLHKVYEMTEEDKCFGHIYPFMMTWPPIFPALKDVLASNAT